MTKNRTLFIISFILIVLPFIGFPKRWEDILTVVVGIILAFITYVSVRKNRLKNVKFEENKNMFEEENIERDTYDPHPQDQQKEENDSPGHVYNQTY